MYYLRFKHDKQQQHWKVLADVVKLNDDLTERQPS